MTLWINGDWVTGQGALRVKRNPVSGEVLWQGNDADAAQVGQALSGCPCGVSALGSALIWRSSGKS